MRAVGYVRVSTAEQAKEGVSLESQAAEIRRYAAARGWVLVNIARDDGVSGSVPLAHRKGGEALMRALETADADAVIVTKLDRAFRDAADCLNVTKVWDEAGIPLVIITLGVDTSTPMGRMFLTMTAAFAELERAQIGERTRDAMAEVKRQGGEVGRAPFGWRYGTEKDARGRRVKVQVPEQQATIKRIVDLYRGGESLRTICADKGMPNRSTVFRWIEADGAFRARYVLAMDARADALAEEILAIADIRTRSGQPYGKKAIENWLARAGETLPKIKDLDTPAN